MKGRANEIALKPTYDGFQRGLSSMMCKFFNQNTGSELNVNEVLAQK